METRTCSTCKNTKPLDRFSSGRGQCKECRGAAFRIVAAPAEGPPKTCSKCGALKAAAMFSPMRGDCKACRAEYLRRYTLEHADELAAKQTIRSKRNYWEDPEAAKARSKKWAQSNKQKVTAKAQRYQDRHPDLLAAKAAERKTYYATHPVEARNRSLRKKYGMAPEEYDTLFRAQEGVCAICGSTPGVRRLAVDHDHVTGKIRGLLCGTCNTGLGAFKDRPHLLLSAATYLLTQKAEQ